MQESFEDDGEIDLELFLKVIESDQLELDAMFEKMDVLLAIRDALSRFHDNLFQIERLLTKPDLEIENFLLGHFYSAAVGAYEVFMRDLIFSLIEHNQSYERLKDALSLKINNEIFINIPKLKEFKENPSKNTLREKIYKTTFIDAQKVTKSIGVWIGFEIAVLEASDIVTSKRNIFTHNGGIRIDGSVETIAVDDVLGLIENLDKNIATAAVVIACKIENLKTH